MKTTISQAFEHCRARRRAALMPFITCGYPTLDDFGPIVAALASSGADLIEIGFPHSDPLADGPVIQRASHLSLERGFTVERGFDAIKNLTATVAQPLIVMCYANLILKAGIDKFVRSCAAAGVAGLIVPDMILEESELLRTACSKRGLDLIPLITPTTPIARARMIAAAATGFIYFVSVTGTTGARSNLNRSLARQVRQIRSIASVPVAVGFGISTPALAAEVATFSEGVIIGSKILQLIDEAGTDREFHNILDFLTEARMKIEAQS
jgi:tryptophan synthase alpha chain